MLIIITISRPDQERELNENAGGDYHASGTNTVTWI